MIYRIIVYIILGFSLIFGYVRYLEIRGIFFPTTNIELTPAAINLSYEDVYIQTKDNLKINGWFISCNNAKYTVLFFSGNAGNIGHRLDKISILNGIGLNIFIIDYRGYGLSQGRPSERGLYRDAEAAYEYLLNSRRILPNQIILYGESLGTAVAINLASEFKVKAIILEGAFSSGKDMAKTIYPFIPAFFFSNKFNSWQKIKNMDVPKLFLHSVDDEIVPLDFARKLFDSASEPKYFEQLRGGHNTAFLDSQDKYSSSLASFLDKL